MTMIIVIIIGTVRMKEDLVYYCRLDLVPSHSRDHMYMLQAHSNSVGH